MTKEEYENFGLRYKGCGACFPIYSELSRFEKMWFTAIQKDVTELTEQNTSLLTSVENLNKSVQELEKENAELQDKLKNLASVAEVRLANWQKYEKENAELKNKLEHRNCLDCSNHSSKLRMKTLELEKECTNAKEIIKKLYAVYYDPCETESDLKYRDDLFAEIKQFLSEVEK